MILTYKITCQPISAFCVGFSLLFVQDMLYITKIRKTLSPTLTEKEKSTFLLQINGMVKPK